MKALSKDKYQGTNLLPNRPWYMCCRFFSHSSSKKEFDKVEVQKPSSIVEVDTGTNKNTK